MGWIIPYGAGDGSWDCYEKRPSICDGSTDLDENGNRILDVLEHVLCQHAVEGSSSKWKKLGISDYKYGELAFGGLGVVNVHNELSIGADAGSGTEVENSTRRKPCKADC